MKRLLIISITLILFAGTAWASDSQKIFSTGKKTATTNREAEKPYKGKIKTLRRVTIDEIKNPPGQTPDKEEEDNPWDDGVDMGC